MSDELLPCPFCGGEPELHWMNEAGEVLTAWVSCKCGCEHHERLTKEVAVKKWNSRHLPNDAQAPFNSAMLDEIAEIWRLVHDQNVSAEAIGIRIRNTWPALEASTLPSAGNAAQTARDQADYKIGWWLSGALEDPAVCVEMKADINAWFEAHQPGLKIDHQSAVASRSDGVAASPRSHAQISELDDANNACLELAAKHGFATGHGDTVGDMIREFSAQIRTSMVSSATQPVQRALELLEERPAAALRAMVIEECAKILDSAAQDWHRIRDLGMANNAKSYAKRIRALAAPSVEQGTK